MQTVTSKEIDGQIGALDAAMLEFSREADELSLAAVSGDAAAATALSDINRKVDGARRDRDVLERARSQAFATETEARERLSAEARDRHMQEARLNASHLLETAKRIDVLTSELKREMSELQVKERAIHAELNAARAPADHGVTGRSGLVNVAYARINSGGALEAFRQTGKTVEETARVGWRYLLNEDEI